LPPWLRVKAPKAPRLHATKAVLDRFGVHTVCQSARCPNIGECFGAYTATFMILGNVCTRSCRFCAVPGGPVLPLDPTEPQRVAEAARELGLEHVVVTSVTRDDLPDGGAAQFARTMAEIRSLLPQATIEVLTPDFRGSEAAIRAVCDAAPDVYNHNVETVPRLYPVVRPQADYRRSLGLLEFVKTIRAQAITKSGIMVGLGETTDEVLVVLQDLRQVGCDMLTIGQYLRPSPRHLPVARYVPPAEFEEHRHTAEAMGFRHVASGPFVRSSYHAAAGAAAVRHAPADASR
jgi:lipoic acid synthetase